MSRLLVVPCIVLGLLLSGCATSHPPIVSRAAPPAPEPENQPAPQWIGAGAVVPSESRQESPLPPPPASKAPPRKQTWTSKVAQKGKNALRGTVRFTGEVILTTVIITGIVGVIALYCMASGNTAQSSGH